MDDVNPADYEVLKVLGEGSYGRALLARVKATGENVVIKEIGLANLTPAEVQDAKNEVKILSSLRCPYIVGYRGSYVDQNCFHIVMEYATDGDLSAKIQENETTGKMFPEGQILSWFAQICQAIKFVHERKILHRDLKSANIFLMADGSVKLGDFGISKVLDHTTAMATTALGSPFYLAPEICRGQAYSRPADVWSLGIILYELCTTRHPFDGASIQDLLRNIVRTEPPPIPGVYSDKLRRLLAQCLEKKPEKRPTVQQILALDFIIAVLQSRK